MKQLFTIKLLLGTIFILTMSGWSFAQVTVTGAVTSLDNGESLPGVNVIIQGTSVGTITDLTGNYKITVPSEEATLVFSSVGFISQEIIVGNRTIIDVALTTDVTALEEIVVVGYGTMYKKDLTTSIAKIDPTQIPNAANGNINDLLFGRAAGLSVSQYSAQPGGQIDLSIRGRGTPLIIVDGIIMPNNGLEPGVNFAEIDNVNRGSLAGLNPADIESIEILKDASAAIYGVEAGNGVVLITTKKGKEGKMNVSYNGSHSWQQNMAYIEPLNANEYMNYVNRFAEDRYLAENDMQPFGSNPPSGFTPPYTDSDISSNTIDTYWLDEVFRNGSIDNHNVSVSGGTEKVIYFLKSEFFNQVGTVKNSDLRKYNLKLDLSFKFNKWLKLNTNIIANRNNFKNTFAGWQTGGAGGNGFTAVQSALAYPPNLPIINPVTGLLTQFRQIGNPVGLITMKDETESNVLFGTASLDFNIIEDKLKAKVLYGNNYENSLRDFYIPSDVNWFDDYRSRASLQWAKRQYQTFETYVTYIENFNDVLSLNAVGGFGEYTNDSYTFGTQSTDMLDAINTDRINGAPTDGNSWRERNKKRSYFVRASFDFLDRYLITGAFRYDGYSQFFPDSKYESFPSVSIGWKISNEAFLNNSNFVNLLKVRASYGTTGSLLPSGAAYAKFEPNDHVMSFDDGASNYVSYRLTQLDHPDLSWQKNITFDVGLDFELLDNRLSGSVDWFRDDITDLLRSNANTPALSLIATQPVNGGHQVRTGIDASLQGDIIRSSEFTWNMLLNIAHYKYRWEERFEEDDLGSHIGIKDPVRSIYKFETDGILQLGQTPPEWQPTTAQTAGSPIFVDQNGDNVLDSADVLIYDQVPKVSIGFNNTFRFKNIDLSIFLYGQYGGWKQNYSLSWASPRGLSNQNGNSSTDIYDAWNSENQSGTRPGSTYDESALGNIGNTVNVGSNYIMAKADFLRARNITLGYTFGMESVKKVVSELRLYFDVQNAFIITNYKGIDPEVAAPGVKGAAAPYPMVRTYSLGINANF